MGGESEKTATSLGLRSELGLALCFDIHVQNGGITHTAIDQIQGIQAWELRERLARDGGQCRRGLGQSGLKR